MSFSPLKQLRKLVASALPTVTGSNQRVFGTVMQGLRATLEDSHFDALVLRLREIEPEWRGFAYEGAGVGFVMLDYLFPWEKRLQAFVSGPGAPYTIPVYIGAGLALARFKSRRPERFLAKLENPAFRWMVLDGYGFAKGYFSRRRFIEEKEIPAHLSDYGHRVFDQGLGRSIWFVAGENVEKVAATIATFPKARQADLWSGSGFACAYAGSSMQYQEFKTLRTLAGPFQSQLALAGALAAKRRHGFGHITPQTELACQVFCDLSGEQAAHIANNALENLPPDSIARSHKVWRERIEAQFAGEVRIKNSFSL